MNSARHNDTIVAIATAHGAAGVGIVRISGPDAVDIVRSIFRRGRSFRRVVSFPTHQMLHGVIVDGHETPVDDVLCCVMHGPHSYTAEDVAEIHTHGGDIVLRRVLALCREHRARPAQPGEFTLRAFLNGRLDLAQAEAVADIVGARSETALRVAERQLRGDLTQRLHAVRVPVLDLLAHCEAVIDFAEEGVPSIADDSARATLDLARTALVDLLHEAKAGRAVREGIRVAIVGRPNVGKSSLLNALLRSDRAIVSAIPGTTRDTVEEMVSLGGVPVTFVDTAGIHVTDDVVEQIGIERAWRALKDSDLALLVLDRSDRLQEQDFELLELLGRPDHAARAPLPHVVILVNKCDLPPAWDAGHLNLAPGTAVVHTSLVGAVDAGPIERAVSAAVLGSRSLDGFEPVLSNQRHIHLLEQCGASLEAARASIDQGLATEFTSIDLRAALEALCDITGENANIELLDEIFRRFCIGK